MSDGIRRRCKVPNISSSKQIHSCIRSFIADHFYPFSFNEPASKDPVIVRMYGSLGVPLEISTTTLSSIVGATPLPQFAPWLRIAVIGCWEVHLQQSVRECSRFKLAPRSLVSWTQCEVYLTSLATACPSNKNKLSPAQTKWCLHTPSTLPADDALSF